MKLNTLRAIALGAVLSISAIASVAYAANPDGRRRADV